LFGAAAIQGVGEKVTDAPRELASIASIWRGTGGRYPLLENAPAVHKLAIVLERYPHSTVMDDRIYLRVQAPPRSTEALGELMRATDSLAAAIATGASGDEEPQCGLR
jgi:hypothetical protein